MHGGGPKVTPGVDIPENTRKRISDSLRRVSKHASYIRTIRTAALPGGLHQQVPDRYDAEVAFVKKDAEAANAWRPNPTILHAAAKVHSNSRCGYDACKVENDFKFLYRRNETQRQSREDWQLVYELTGKMVSEAEAKAKKFEQDPKYNEYAT
jgi:formate--tetrahydrofolate ligase